MTAPTRRRRTLIRYRLRLLDLNRHHYQIECRVTDPAPEQSFSLPSWIPGSYLLREYARYVVAIEATSEAGPLAVEKTGKAAWSCRGAERELCVTITVYALDLSVRGAYLDARRAYFNGPCVFLLPEGRAAEAVSVELEAPSNAACEGWRVATAMEAVAVDARGFGRYAAADYDELIDHPVEIGPFAEVTFEAAGVPHRFVVAGRVDTDLERVAADLRQVCETQIDFFGRPAPFASYTFLGLAVGEGYGGLEHRASSSLVFRRNDLPKPGEPGIPPEYRRFLALASHEYFHSWHIKRSKPAAFMPYRLDRRNHTRLLWVFEGVTSYYQERMLLKSGLLGAAAYLQRVGEQLTRVYRAPGRFKQSIAAASFDAWDILYKPEPSSPNMSISYYSKGALTALALDLSLRLKSASTLTLDDVLRELWRRHGALEVGVEEHAFEALVVELAGTELESFFDRAVRGTDDLPLAATLAEFAVAMHMRAARGPEDTGGQKGPEGPVPLGLGASFRRHEQGLELLTVFDGGPAERAGLNPGDIVLAIDGLKVDERNLKQRLERHEPAERVSVTAFRGDELIELGLVFASAPLDTCYLELDPGASGEALERRRAWLGE